MKNTAQHLFNKVKSIQKEHDEVQAQIVKLVDRRAKLYKQAEEYSNQLIKECEKQGFIK